MPHSPSTPTHTLTMCSGVSGRQQVIGSFPDQAIADAVGKLLLAADAQNHPEWVSYEVHVTPDEKPQSPSYDALLLIAQSVCGALARGGMIDCDDPGEAIDVMRERYETRIASLEAERGER